MLVDEQFERAKRIDLAGKGIFFATLAMNEWQSNPANALINARKAMVLNRTAWQAWFESLEYYMGKPKV